jgi:beta-galactosidase
MKPIKTIIMILCCLLCSKGYAAKPVFKLVDFFITTTMNSIETEFLIKNTSSSFQKGFVNLKITDANGKSFTYCSQQQIALAAGGAKKIKLSKQQLKPKLWSPEHPVLYTMLIAVTINDKVEVTALRKIGFKTFEIRGNLFYLNGSPYYLRALSQWPPARVVDEKGVLAPNVWADEHFVKKFFEKIKSLNINAGRVGDDALWVKYADEMGILNITGSYAGAGAADDDIFLRNKKDFTPKILDLRSHVSTAIYTLANEISWERNPNFLKLGKENYEFAKTLDPTRPMIANAGFGKGKVGDIEDMHDYTGWYGGTVLDMVDYEEQDLYKKEGGSKQPITFTECVGTYTAERTGRFHLLTNKGLSNALRHVGRGGQHPEDPLWYQKVITKEMMEGMRRARGMESRLCGSFPFSDYWTWDVPNKTFMAKPAAEVLRQVYSPVLLSFKTWNRHAFAGDQISGDLYVVNDDVTLGDLTNATVTISLEQDGKLLKSLNVAVPLVKYYGTVKIPVSILVPVQIKAGAAKIVMKLNHQKASSVANEMDIFIAAKGFANVDTKQQIMLFDPEGNTAQALKNIDATFNDLSVIKSGANKSLIVGAKVLAQLSNEQVGDILVFANNGGRVLVLEQEVAQLNNSPLLPDGIKSKRYQSLFVNTERPGLLDEGLANRDFFLWNHSKSASNFPVVNVFNMNAALLKETAVLANCGPVLQNPVVLEYFKGKGSIIFSQFELVERVGNDPIAAKVFANLIKYLQTPNHSLGLQLNKDVIFADLDSEAGLFAASLKQGMVINSHNYGSVSWEKFGWPDGRRIVGEQKITNSLGYIGAIKPADTASGFFYLHPPVGTRAFYLEVKNPVGKQLWFSIKLNDKPVGEVVTVAANTSQKYGPWPIPIHSTPLKVTIVSETDQHAPHREKLVIEELVFQKMIFK